MARVDHGAATGTTTDDTPVGLIRPVAEGSRRVRTSGRRPRRRNLRRAGRAVLLVVVALVVYVGVSFVQVWSTGRSDYTGQVDAIVVMGAAQYDGTPSPQLEARLEHAAALWPSGRAQLVVVTGGNQPGDRFTEAQASSTYLAEHGVPESAIVLEDQGRSSYESLRGVAALLAQRGLDEVLIVTDPYHALRSRLIAGEVGLDAHVSPTPTSVVHGDEQTVRELQEAAGVALGRLIGFEHI